MKLTNKIILIVLISLSMIFINCNNVCAEYVIQVVPNETAWTNISVSDAYDACQNLNTTYSTLGTESLKAHLTTNADWYAVSLLTYSAYGDKSNINKTTTGNNSGIVNIATLAFTSSLMYGYNDSNPYISKLVENINTSYVETVYNVKDEELRSNNIPGRGLLESEYITSAYGTIYSASSTGCPVVCRQNLFGFWLGHSVDHTNMIGAKGAANPNTTFRPVIWNK